MPDLFPPLARKLRRARDIEWHNCQVDSRGEHDGGRQRVDRNVRVDKVAVPLASAHHADLCHMAGSFRLEPDQCSNVGQRPEGSDCDRAAVYVRHDIVSQPCRHFLRGLARIRRILLCRLPLRGVLLPLPQALNVRRATGRFHLVPPGSA